MSKPAPLSSSARGDRTRERASHAKIFSLGLALADDLPMSMRSDIAHLLIGDWSADAYGPAREILAGLAESFEPPTAEPGQAKIAVARRLSKAVAEAVASQDPRSGLLQLESLIRELRHAWLGRDADAPEMVLLRNAARQITDRKAMTKAQAVEAAS